MLTNLYIVDHVNYGDLVDYIDCAKIMAMWTLLDLLAIDHVNYIDYISFNSIAPPIAYADNINYFNHFHNENHVDHTDHVCLPC